MERAAQKQYRLYQWAVVFSVLFALVGFSYNVWRMQVSEQNSNIRTACFEVLLELAALEQLVFAAHFDKDAKEGNPRKGWVKVGLIQDLSVLTDPRVEARAAQLKMVWSAHWPTMANDRQSADQITAAIDALRGEVKRVLHALD